MIKVFQLTHLSSHTFLGASSSNLTNFSAGLCPFLVNAVDLPVPLFGRDVVSLLAKTAVYRAMLDPVLRDQLRELRWLWRNWHQVGFSCHLNQWISMKGLNREWDRVRPHRPQSNSRRLKMMETISKCSHSTSGYFHDPGDFFATKKSSDHALADEGNRRVPQGPFWIQIFISPGTGSWSPNVLIDGLLHVISCHIYISIYINIIYIYI